MKAFPTTHTNDKGYFESREHGMDLRDYFAAKIMHALIVVDEDIGMRELAKDTYELADIMMEVRNDNNATS